MNESAWALLKGIGWNAGRHSGMGIVCGILFLGALSTSGCQKRSDTSSEVGPVVNAYSSVSACRYDIDCDSGRCESGACIPTGCSGCLPPSGGNAYCNQGVCERTCENYRISDSSCARPRAVLTDFRKANIGAHATELEGECSGADRMCKICGVAVLTDWCYNRVDVLLSAYHIENFQPADVAQFAIAPEIIYFQNERAGDPPCTKRVEWCARITIAENSHSPYAVDWPVQGYSARVVGTIVGTSGNAGDSRVWLPGSLSSGGYNAWETVTKFEYAGDGYEFYEVVDRVQSDVQISKVAGLSQFDVRNIGCLHSLSVYPDYGLDWEWYPAEEMCEMWGENLWPHTYQGYAEGMYPDQYANRKPHSLAIGARWARSSCPEYSGRVQVLWMNDKEFRGGRWETILDCSHVAEWSDGGPDVVQMLDVLPDLNSEVFQAGYAGPVIRCVAR